MTRVKSDVEVKKIRGGVKCRGAGKVLDSVGFLRNWAGKICWGTVGPAGRGLASSPNRSSLPTPGTSPSVKSTGSGASHFEWNRKISHASSWTNGGSFILVLLLVRIGFVVVLVAGIVVGFVVNFGIPCLAIVVVVVSVSVVEIVEVARESEEGTRIGMMSIPVEAIAAYNSLSDDKELIDTYERLTTLNGKRMFPLAAAGSHKKEVGILRSGSYFMTELLYVNAGNVK
ncbi:exocyst complex component SEC6 [Tanacetum coccineum]